MKFDKAGLYLYFYLLNVTVIYNFFTQVIPSPKDKSKVLKALAQLGLIVGLTRRPTQHEPGIEGFLASVYEDYLLDDK